MAVLWLGPLAGLITTVCGLGGGLGLVLALQAITGDPLKAMVVASPALLVGNVHRAWLFRRSLPLDVPVTRPWLVAVAVGGALGGLGAVAVPAWVLQAGMVLATAVAVVRQLGGWTSVPRPRTVVGAGLVVGLGSTTGGAGLLAAPLLLSLGFQADRYLAILSLSAVAMHFARLVSFGALGQLDLASFGLAGGLAGGIALGNVAGRRIRHALSERTVSRLQNVTMVAMVALALIGAR